ncbi:transposase, partial [Salmonella enterica]|uniref:transposase n=1 Tax=Salmonella enterica TaxID=28901 RepID=UPI003F5A004F
MKAHVRAIFEAAEPETARSLLERTLGTFQETAPKAMKVLEEGFEDETAVSALPAVCPKRTTPNNALERLNAELR